MGKVQDFGSIQVARRLGLAGWQLWAARRQGLIAEPDRGGRWSGELLADALARIDEIRAALPEEGAVMDYDHLARPIYRRGRAPAGLVTAAQLREKRLSSAGLAPIAWLHYAYTHHRICALYDLTAARPIRPLTDRQRANLAAGRALANTVVCRECGQVRVPKWDDQLCGSCAPIVEARRRARWRQVAPQ